MANRTLSQPHRVAPGGPRGSAPLKINFSLNCAGGIHWILPGTGYTTQPGVDAKQRTPGHTELPREPQRGSTMMFGG